MVTKAKDQVKHITPILSSYKKHQFILTCLTTPEPKATLNHLKWGISAPNCTYSSHLKPCKATQNKISSFSLNTENLT